MCGIVGAATRREVSEILLEGLRRLEYRGYDSAGMALIDNEQHLQIHKQVGKVAKLEEAQRLYPIFGCTGIAHTRWATHGEPSGVNAHPHISGDRVAVVHNGIIENHRALRQSLEARGYSFRSGTDTEVVVHLMHEALDRGVGLLDALAATVAQLHGAFALAMVDIEHPNEVVIARRGSPLVIGVGIGENFIASDQLALRQVTDRFIYLEEGDFARVTPTEIQVFDINQAPVERRTVRITDLLETAELGQYDHYMLKEIHEQPRALAATRDVLLDEADNLLEQALGEGASAVLDRVARVQIVACGTSYHAGMVARYWLEDLGVPCQVEVASEFRYRKRAAQPDTLLLTISQSGETADTLAALRNLKAGEFLASLVVANVNNSALVRESDLVYLTRAGVEIGVASTKAFTTQLVALLLLSLALGRRRGLTDQRYRETVAQLRNLPQWVDQVLELDPMIREVANEFVPKQHALFLGRGVHYPIALEGALKLKEISYIHAEAYPAGELKHGPLALVDADMPVVAVAPSDELLEKLRSNLEEVRSRGGQLYVFADHAEGFADVPGIRVMPMPACHEALMPMVYTVALQLLAYHVAVARGTDVDKPRNLAKSVTVE
jgi:glucosamine--fructose-6-phosphate aminotransferase (isomerizing)